MCAAACGHVGRLVGWHRSVVHCLLRRLAFVFLFQAEDGIRDLVRSRGLGDVYQRQSTGSRSTCAMGCRCSRGRRGPGTGPRAVSYTHPDAADERSSVDLGGGRIIKTKKTKKTKKKTNIEYDQLALDESCSCR